MADFVLVLLLNVSSLIFILELAFRDQHIIICYLSYELFYLCRTCFVPKLIGEVSN